MNIIGPDYLVFGVDDMDACKKTATDYGLVEVEGASGGGTYEAMDGTGIIMRKSSDTGLPSPNARSPNIRDIRYGVADKTALDAIAAELSKDREVTSDNGIISSVDEDGFAISFQETLRRRIEAPHYGVNVPGQEPGRAINAIANVAEPDLRPRTLSHVVLFTADKDKAEKFYAERLGFRTSDAFIELGPFMRPAGTNEHHTLFFIQAPVKGVQHFTFHFAGANEVLKGGWEFENKGYKSVWGPGRHVLGSNYFWYFASPFGGDLEFDADMDLHDDNWKPRYVHIGMETSQSFLFQFRDKWLPGPK